MKLYYNYGLPFAEIVLLNDDKSITLTKALIDTGSATTIISTEIAIYLGLGLQSDDELSLVRGVGGVETVYEESVENIMVDTAILKNLKLMLGQCNMDLK